MKIKNATLANEKFTQAIEHVTSLVWGREKDALLYDLLVQISAAQTEINHHRKNYMIASGILEEETKETIASFQRQWEPLLEEETDLDWDKIPLTLNSRRMLSTMERFQLKDLFDFEVE